MAQERGTASNSEGSSPLSNDSVQDQNESVQPTPPTNSIDPSPNMNEIIDLLNSGQTGPQIRPPAPKISRAELDSTPPQQIAPVDVDDEENYVPAPVDPFSDMNREGSRILSGTLQEEFPDDPWLFDDDELLPPPRFRFDHIEESLFDESQIDQEVQFEQPEA